jgi:hypothetical protein
METLITSVNDMVAQVAIKFCRSNGDKVVAFTRKETAKELIRIGLDYSSD